MNLARVEQALAAELTSTVATPAGGGLLPAAERHLCLADGAKRARPRLCLLFGEAAGAPEDGVVDAAVAVELVHSASLLHDDVVDEGLERRGRPTVNTRYGNSVAVLAGDHLLSRALLRLARHPRALSTKAIEVVAEMSRAAIVEVETRGAADVPIATWRGMAVGKTGALFGLCGYAAAVLAGDEARAARWNDAGRRLGVAFQLRDDLDDLVAPVDDAAAQPPLGDLLSRTPSYPILAACARDAALRARVEEAWRAPRVSEATARALADACVAAGALQASRDAIDVEVAAIRAALAPEAAHPAVRAVLEFAERLRPDVGSGAAVEAARAPARRTGT